MSQTITEQYVTVNNVRLHYVESGEGNPIVFLHGIPTSSYLWRHMIPVINTVGRCIALDLVGCGMSEQPNIKYTINEHIEYFKHFIETLQLKNIILVMHGWGSVIGCDYAMKHQENIKGLVLYESYIRPTMDWDALSLPVRQIMSLLSKETNGKETILHSDYFMEKIFPLGFMKKLSPDELAIYKKPFATEQGRKVIWRYLCELPMGQQNKGATDIIHRYSEKLQKSPIPKLMLYAVPGFLTTIDTVLWAKQSLPNISIVEIDEALHYAQETCPEIMADEIVRWCRKQYRSGIRIPTPIKPDNFPYQA